MVLTRRPAVGLARHVLRRKSQLLLCRQACDGAGCAHASKRRCRIKRHPAPFAASGHRVGNAMKVVNAVWSRDQMCNRCKCSRGGNALIAAALGLSPADQLLNGALCAVGHFDLFVHLGNLVFAHRNVCFLLLLAVLTTDIPANQQKAFKARRAGKSHAHALHDMQACRFAPSTTTKLVAASTARAAGSTSSRRVPGRRVMRHNT